MNNRIEEMLHTNEGQHEYYEKASGSAESPLNSRATNIWRRLRRNAFIVFRNAEIQDSIVRSHVEWIGDVSNAKVLDLGLGEGNPLSLKLASEAREYVAIDLSSTRMAVFRQKLKEAGIKRARTYIADFLGEDFPESDFDVVYAMAIFHHFRYLEAFLEQLESRMSPRGIAVTQDPIQTWLPVRLVRMAYRPFQTDAAWEFPFTRESLEALQRVFDIERVQGVYGRSKWAIPISALSPETAKKLAQRWHIKDLQYATDLKSIESCLRVSFLLRKKPARPS